MTIKELIESLKQYDENNHVFVNGYEEGFDMVEIVNNILVVEDDKKKDKWWKGSYRQASENDQNKIKGIVLPRKS